MNRSAGKYRYAADDGGGGGRKVVVGLLVLLLGGGAAYLYVSLNGGGAQPERRVDAMAVDAGRAAAKPDPNWSAEAVKARALKRRSISKVRVTPSMVDYKARNFSRKFKSSLKVTVDDLLAGEYKGGNGYIMRYRYFVPEGLKPGQKAPLVIFLHGDGECGRDNRLQLSRHPEPLIFVQPRNQKEYPCFFLAPQQPSRRSWCSGVPGHPAQAMKAAVAIIDRLIAEYPAIDTNRLYVTGLSSGGMGAWDALAKYPGKFAGAVPICAGWAPNAYHDRQQPCVWAFYTKGEHRYIRERTDAILKKLAEFGCDVRRTVYSQQRGHFTWRITYAEPDLIPWLFSHSLAGKAAAPQ